MQGYRDAQKGGGGLGERVSKGTTYVGCNLQIKQKGLILSSTSWTGPLDFQPIFVHGDEVLDHELERKKSL
jgi:hypothetical protein